MYSLEITYADHAWSSLRAESRRDLLDLLDIYVRDTSDVIGLHIEDADGRPIVFNRKTRQLEYVS